MVGGGADPFLIRSTPNSWLDMDQYNRTNDRTGVGSVPVRDRQDDFDWPASTFWGICGVNVSNIPFMTPFPNVTLRVM